MQDPDYDSNEGDNASHEASNEYGFIVEDDESYQRGHETAESTVLRRSSRAKKKSQKFADEETVYFENVDHGFDANDDDYVDSMNKKRAPLSKRRKTNANSDNFELNSRLGDGENGNYEPLKLKFQVKSPSNNKKKSSKKKEKQKKKNKVDTLGESDDERPTLIIDDPNSYYDSDEYDSEGRLIKREEIKKQRLMEERLQRKLKRKPNTPHLLKKYVPVPVDERGEIIFPIRLKGLTIHSLGHIIYDRPKFHAKR
jgi:hypothetical protein